MKASKSTIKHNIIWTLLRYPVGKPWMALKFGFRTDNCKVKGPFLVIANHNTDWDPVLLGCAFPRYVSFVASEHIFRWGAKTKLIRWVFDPIPILKGTVATGTARAILEKLKSGTGVVLFGEGNRSFNGVSGEISPSTAKLARLCGVPVITYRFEGGYLTSPRWSRTLRRGKLRGRIVNVYSAEELRAMKPAEIAEKFSRDIYEDAFARQEEKMISYKGKRLAEGLESLLCLCPSCRRVGTLKSEDDRFRCSCGLEVRYLPNGFFEGENLPFKNLYEWDNWQNEQLPVLAPDASGVIFSDTDMTVREIFPDHTDKVLGTGDVVLTERGLTVCGMEFPDVEIGGFSLHGPQTVNLHASGRDFEIYSDSYRCMRKYLTVLRQRIPYLQ